MTSSMAIPMKIGGMTGMMNKLADISAFEHLQNQANESMGLVSSMAVFNEIPAKDVKKLFGNGKLVRTILKGMENYVKVGENDHDWEWAKGSDIDYLLYKSFRSYYKINRDKVNQLFQPIIDYFESTYIPAQTKARYYDRNNYWNWYYGDLTGAVGDSLPASINSTVKKILKDSYQAAEECNDEDYGDQPWYKAYKQSHKDSATAAVKAVNDCRYEMFANGISGAIMSMIPKDI